MPGKFWENEEPEVIEGRFLEWRYYPVAGKLQLTHKRMTELGTKYRTITVDYRDLTPEVKKILMAFMGK